MRFTKLNVLKLTSFFHFFTLYVFLLMHPNCFVSSIYQTLNGFYSILKFYFKYQNLYACKLDTLNWWKSLKCKKVRFTSEMSEINSRWVILNLKKWTHFKSVLQWDNQYTKLPHLGWRKPVDAHWNSPTFSQRRLSDVDSRCHSFLGCSLRK